MWKTAVVSLYLLTLGIMDIREKKVPVILLALGVVSALVIGMSEKIEIGTEWINIAGELFLGMIPGGFLLAVACLTNKAGYGDGLVLMILGMIYGYLPAVILLCVSLFLLSLFSIGLLVLGKAHRNTCIPYLPFLTIVYLVYFLGKCVNKF